MTLLLAFVLVDILEPNIFLQYIPNSLHQYYCCKISMRTIHSFQSDMPKISKSTDGNWHVVPKSPIRKQFQDSLREMRRRHIQTSVGNFHSNSYQEYVCIHHLVNYVIHTLKICMFQLRHRADISSGEDACASRYNLCRTE